MTKEQIANLLTQEVVAVYKLYYKDFEAIVNSVYKVDDYRFTVDYECANDSSHEFTVDKHCNDQLEIDMISTFRETGKGLYLASIILDDLCDSDLIPAGNYIINVCW